MILPWNTFGFSLGIILALILGRSTGSDGNEANVQHNGLTLDASVGDNVILPCTNGSIPEGGFVRWRYESQTLLNIAKEDGEEGHKRGLQDPRIGSNGSALVLREVDSSHTGKYTCEIHHSNTIVHFLTHTLFVKGEEVYHTGGTSVTAQAGTTATLHCNLLASLGAKFTWKFGKTIVKGPSTERKLVIPNVQPDNMGIYKCQSDTPSLVHQGEFYESSAFHLEVLSPPDVVAVDAVVYTGVGVGARVACRARANPRARVTWHPHTLRAFLAPTRHMGAGVYIFNLEFDRVQRRDFGTYTCIAANVIGNASATVTLTGRPKPARFLSSHEANEDDTFTLSWEVESHEAVLDYRVEYTNGSGEGEWAQLTIPGTQSSSIFHSQMLTLTDLAPRAMYHARVAARNEFGWGGEVTTYFYTRDYVPTTTMAAVSSSAMSEVDTTQAATTSEEPISQHQASQQALHESTQDLQDIPSLVSSSIVNASCWFTVAFLSVVSSMLF